jgi:hypothetical protein
MLSGVVRLIANHLVLILIGKRVGSRGPSLHRRYPASAVLRPRPTPVSCRRPGRRSRRDPRPTRVSHVTRNAFWTCRLHYPGGPDERMCWLLTHRHKPSPLFRKVGVRNSRFEACSEFTHVTARTVARPPVMPKVCLRHFAAFVTGLRRNQLPGHAARQLPSLTNKCLRGSCPHWHSAPAWRTKEVKIQGGKSDLPTRNPKSSLR